MRAFGQAGIACAYRVVPVSSQSGQPRASNAINSSPFVSRVLDVPPHTGRKSLYFAFIVRSSDARPGTRKVADCHTKLPYGAEGQALTHAPGDRKFEGS